LTVANSSQTYYMTVLLPDDITPTFYIKNGYDENGADILGDTLVSAKGEAADGYTAYSVAVPENISEISVRDTVYGGMAIPASSESTVKLCKVQTKIIDFGDREIEGMVSVSYDTHKAVGVAGNFLLIPVKEYSFTASPENTSAYNKATENVVLEEDTNTVNIKTSYKNPKTIVTTTGAEAKLFKYSNNYFIHTAYEPLATVDSGDGTSTHYFTADGDLSYRVSMDGAITKAGYLTRNSATVLHTELDAAPTDRAEYEASGTDAAIVADDSVLLNINQQNHLSLSVGQTKTVKAYRAWEIINNHMNHIIEPDFHFNIVSGDDVVSLSPYENQPMTNSSGNWRKLTAIGEGTAIIEVTYDAILIDGGSYSGFYGATDPARTGLFIVTVGTEVPDVDFGIKSKTSAGSVVYKEENKKPWDSEFDTLYFFGESGEIKLSPALAGGEVTEVAVSSDKGNAFKILEASDGIYTAPIISGNNIIRVTTDIGIAYKIVRGDRIELSVKNITNPGKPVEAGDKISLKLNGVHTPIPKISGTFNPGYSGNTDGESKVHINYSFGENTLISTGRQYDFSLYGTTIEFTLPSDCEETELTLTDGYMGVGVIGVTGFSDDGDSHRNIPDNGSGTREDKTTFTTRSLLPDITVSVGMLPSGNIAPFIRENAPQSATLNLGGTYALSMSKVFFDRDADAMTYTAKVGEGEAVATEAYYTFTPDAVGTYTISFTANDGEAESDLHTIILAVKEKETTSKPSLEFDISGGEIKGYVNISFTDKGKRVEGEENVEYPKALGTIISSKRVPFAEGDTVADVTLRLLDALNFTYEYTGTTKEGFYLASIGDFEVKGISYDSFGEFDAGSGSGWMITLNKKFIKYGASEFEVKKGDTIKWQYTCQLGEDIGDPFYSKTPSKKDNEKPIFTENTFADVKKGDWHYESVKYVYENNLMQGTDNGFEPEKTMSRAMLVTVLFRIENPKTIKGDKKFSDVSDNLWYTDAVSWAAETGIVSGVSETQFAPEENITREQMALIIYRYAKMKGYDIEADASLSSFADKNEVSDWALDAIKWANKEELVNGTSETTLSPKATANRAQVAAILMRFCENVAK
ncbi:MAG: S-layer homology domain-containing protein, partial [Clostridia bacterium]|nr:S-layer homology domain-containing protein [Clostridia bacterium]